MKYDFFNSKLEIWFKLFILLIFTAIPNGFVFAATSVSANFSWLPNPEPVAGYKIHYGTKHNGPYDLEIDVGKPSPLEGRIKATVPGLIYGTTYYFVATAYSDSGEEGPYSTEVSYPPPNLIMIAEDAPHTANPNVTLTLSAKNVTEMKFSNNDNDWTEAERYRENRDWVLSDGFGTKTVYVKFKDEAGKWSASYKDTIILNLPKTTNLRIKK